MPLRLEMDDLTTEGQRKLEQDYQTIERRDRCKTSREDFALGWMACATRYGMRGLFTPEAQQRLWRSAAAA